MTDLARSIWLEAIAIVAEARNKCVPGERFEALNLVMGDLEDARRRDQAKPAAQVTVEESLCDDILAELARARSKFPGKNVTFAALVEEVGELATATFEESADRVRKEAVQVAVMAMRMILDGDLTFEPWRSEKGLDPLDPALRASAGDGEL